MTNDQSLKEENEKLKEDNAMKIDLLSMSAHQIRSSLSAIKWILKMVIDGDAGEINSEQSELLKKAFASNERMISLTSDMLDLAHTEDIVKGYTFEKTSIDDLIDSVIFEFLGETKKHKMEIIFLKPETYEHPSVDKEKMRMVFQNLIENAIKYGNDGTKIFISLTEEGDSLKVSIKDTGIGIPQDAAPHIFGKFYRAQNAIAKAEIGSGLGLFTIKKIVERHGGKIWFESHKDDGTTFYVTIPFSAPV